MNPATLAMKFLLILALVLHTAFARADLATYVGKAEPEAKWELVKKSKLGACEVFVLKVKSQVWETIPWEHDLILFRPEGAVVEDKMFLFNNGGKFSDRTVAYGAMLATMMKVPVALLLGIPNQPLFDGKKEDDLIAETFVRYLETEDADWPLLFPMVKSLVKSMDFIQEFTAKEWPKKIVKFGVGGASKRGWTTWLTAAIDPRVMVISPMVIDVLNMPEQMKRQVECFGGPSEQIRPYVARNLVPIPDTEKARRLWTWVDPWTYREKFVMPKLILLGNNDRYWAPDALNLYWDGLPGPKWICYTPNAGHDLTALIGGIKNPMKALQTNAAFMRLQLSGQPLPELTWKHDEAGDKLRLTVTCKPAPKEIRVWSCNAPTKDLRIARWESQLVEMKDGVAEILQPRPTAGVSAFFADTTYETDGLVYNLSTQLRMVEAMK